MDDRGFYRRWTVANGWSEGAGLGTIFVVGMAAANATARAWRQEPVGQRVVLFPAGPAGVRP